MFCPDLDISKTWNACSVSCRLLPNMLIVGDGHIPERLRGQDLLWEVLGRPKVQAQARSFLYTKQPLSPSSSQQLIVLLQKECARVSFSCNSAICLVRAGPPDKGICTGRPAQREASAVQLRCDHLLHCCSGRCQEEQSVHGSSGQCLYHRQQRFG